MFKRKLTALQFHNAEAFDISDQKQLRNLIVWLEDQKIRHYKIEDREPLRNTDNATWSDVFSKYNNDLGNPVPLSDTDATLDWLLGFAVKLEYGDNAAKYEGSGQGASKPASTNPLEGIDFDCADFKVGVMSLATLLQIPTHPDHKQLLKAISVVIRDRLSPAAIEKAKKVTAPSSASIPLDKVELGFKTDDYVTAEAAKVLRLLHIHDLRELQDSVNQAIVHVQTITANPKTDTRLGKVGR